MTLRPILRAGTAFAFLALAAACGQQTAQSPKAETTADSGPTAAAAPSGLSMTSDAPPVVGKPVTLTLKLTSADGKPLGPDQIATQHTQKVHVMIVDSGLEDYTHVHAMPGATQGDWKVSFTPKFGRTYKVWADFKEGNDAAMAEAHAGHDMANMDMGEGKEAPHVIPPSAPLVVGPEAAPAIAPTQSLSGSAGGLNFSLSLAGAVKKDEHVAATLAVQDAATGQPFTGLEPIMGAYAHLVGFSADGNTMMHGHPEGAEPKDASARGGPALTFELHPSAAGPTRIFLQVQKGGQVLTVPMTLVVAP